LKVIQTIKGRVPVEDLGLILPHEHLFTDLRGPRAKGYAKADPATVGKVMKPFLEEAYRAGVTVLVECSTVGVGRNIEVMQYLADLTPIHLILPTGVYREAYIPPTHRMLNERELADLWIRELCQGVEGTKILAGFIKIAMSDEGPTEIEIRCLRAAAIASQATGAVIASHTANWGVACKEMDILEEEGLDLSCFIWVHANLDSETDHHQDAARRGAYVEFDAIGAEWQDQQALLSYTLKMIEAGYGHQVLLSHDAGWFDPATPDGKSPEGQIRGYTELVKGFIPQLRGQGLSDETLHRLTVTNPARAFAFVGSKA
jgi:phosphotriesterase-related protein